MGGMLHARRGDGKQRETESGGVSSGLIIWASAQYLGESPLPTDDFVRLYNTCIVQVLHIVSCTER